MNAKPLIPLAAALITACTGTSPTVVEPLATAPASEVAAMRVVDLPTVTVRPEAEDLAFYEAGRVVDLAAITVRPAAGDREFRQNRVQSVGQSALSQKRGHRTLAFETRLP